MNPRPPEDTPPDTLHWLYRPTGAPHWMVATWTGEGWNTLSGRIERPEDMVFWNYSAPAAPPGSRESDHRKAAMLECRSIVQKLADEFVHEHFACDPETGTWEPDGEIQEAYVEALDEAGALIDRRIAAEFPDQVEAAP